MKSNLLLVVGTVTVIGAVLLVWLHPRSSPTIPGDLSREDFSRIQHVTHRDMWRRAFPNASWQTIKQSPRSLYRLATSRISQIHTRASKDSVEVQIGSRFGDCYYLLEKCRRDTGGWNWRVLGTGPLRLVSVFGPYRGPESFGRSLSFGASAFEMPSLPSPHSQALATANLPSGSEFSASLSNHAKLKLGR